MKKTSILTFIYFAIFFGAVSITSCDQDDANPVITPPVLTNTEIADLQFMREEEKLARDAYQYFYDLYELNVFQNIAASEQRHMDAVLDLLQYYNLEDPTLDAPGLFSNPDLQQLYDELIAQGDASLVAALAVGATIEDVDIRDLDNALASTDRERIINVYESLQCGSRNHLRAFTGQFDSRGESYTPQYISTEAYEDILEGSHEHCGE